jgi:hypothetical protein
MINTEPDCLEPRIDKPNSMKNATHPSLDRLNVRVCDGYIAVQCSDIVWRRYGMAEL